MAGSASSPSPSPPLAAVILAAGRGSRMGGALPSKVLAPVAGKPMLLHAVEAADAAGLAPVIVVVGHAAAAVEAVLHGQPVTLVQNSAPEDGMAASLRAGLAAVPHEATGVAVLLGDMPGVRAEHVERLLRAFAAAGGHAIVAPTCGGRRGNPVLWPRDLFPDLAAVVGDQGGRAILQRHAGRVVTVPLDETADHGTGVLRDIDTPEDLDGWKD